MHPKAKRSRISSLHENRAGPCELTYQPFTGTDARYNPPARYAFKNVFAVPRYQMAIVDDILFSILQLKIGGQQLPYMNSMRCGL